MLESASMTRAGKLVVFAFAFAALGYSQGPQNSEILSEKQTLAQQSRMAVALEMISIRGYNFQADVEDALRQAGITVLPSNNRTPTYPLLRLAIGGTIANQLNPPELNYRIHLQFIQLFQLSNNRYIRATTWSAVRSGLTPWNGVLLASQAIAAVQKDAMDVLNTFLDDWREANGAATAEAVPASHLFDGIWRGTYSCAGMFGGIGQSTWTIHEVRPGKVEAGEQWSRFASGHYNYTGTISGRTLEVTTEEGGYSVEFTISDDGTMLNGRYIGHPSQCQTVSLRKVQ